MVTFLLKNENELEKYANVELEQADRSDIPIGN
jgi:hypothetical protein